MRKKIDKLISHDSGVRLDAYLTKHFTGYSRSFFQNMIGRGYVRVDGVERERSFRLSAGQLVEIKWPIEAGVRDEGSGVRMDGNWDFEKAILFEDNEVLVLNKPSGLVVHPAGTSWLNHPRAALMESRPSLVGYLLKLRPKIIQRKVPRMGVVHRLDAETSGVMVVAKTAPAYNSLMNQFKLRQVKKVYRAVVKGAVKNDQGLLEIPLGRKPHGRKIEVMGSGKEAVTGYRVVKRSSAATLLEVFPKTGRTHQIRVHLSTMGHPVVGDHLYGKKNEASGVPRMLLHAYQLEFDCPRTGKRVRFKAVVPTDFKKAWNFIKSE
ncbi:MAG: RluA family pseudouridine synthase [Elusimicrobia bacterium]|nr:RluA family pseudouridine synthase [Elusimicrobiota bacterium]